MSIFVADCPVCGSRVGAHVIDTSDSKLLRAAVRDADRWRKDGLRVSVVETATVRRHAESCEFLAR